MLAVLGGLLLYLAMTVPLGATQIFLLVFGLVALWSAMRLQAATAQTLILTERALITDRGDELAQVDEMEKVERGAFAFKPSNGFLLTTRSPGPRRWAPGLFWAMGRRIGVGGVTGAPQSKAMAEAIAGLIALRDQSR